VHEKYVTGLRFLDPSTSWVSTAPAPVDDASVWR